MFTDKDKNLFLSNDDVKGYVLNIIQQMNQESWSPDIVLGFTRGGLTPANYISQWYDIPMVAINKSSEFNERLDYDNVLVIDDINDTGSTLASFNEKIRPRLRTVKYAAIVNNEASSFDDIDYMGYSFNKLEEPNWIVFPWENWWR